MEPEYFADAVDRDEDVDLAFRSGRSRRVTSGAWLVNCTGTLLRKPHPSEPFVTVSGRTLSWQMRSSSAGALPTKVLLDCGLDYDLWYPLPRRRRAPSTSCATTGVAATRRGRAASPHAETPGGRGARRHLATRGIGRYHA